MCVEHIYKYLFGQTTTDVTAEKVLIKENHWIEQQIKIDWTTPLSTMNYVYCKSMALYFQ